MTKQDRKNALRSIQLSLSTALAKQDQERVIATYLQLEDLLNAHGLYMMRTPPEVVCPTSTSN